MAKINRDHRVIENIRQAYLAIANIRKRHFKPSPPPLARAEAAERLAVWAAKKPHLVMSAMASIMNSGAWTDADLLRALKEASGVE